MKNIQGQVLYVGKAKNLKSRILSYFRSEGEGDGRYQIKFLMKKVADVEVVLTQNEKEALRLANLSRYGLGGAIFSRDEERARELARVEMDCGMVAIYDFVRSDAVAPFGGVKDSGLGREFGRDGSFEFTVTKSVFSKT